MTTACCPRVRAVSIKDEDHGCVQAAVFPHVCRRVRAAGSRGRFQPAVLVTSGTGTSPRPVFCFPLVWSRAPCAEDASLTSDCVASSGAARAGAGVSAPRVHILWMTSLSCVVNLYK